MITPLLEKAIAEGKATYSKFTHAFGTWGGLKVPDGKTIIITDVKFTPFINPYANSPGITFQDFLNYNEYQLRIDGKKSKNFMIYRNHISFIKTSDAVNFLMTDTLGSVIATGAVHFVPPPPVIQDVFFICEEYIKIAITRNGFRDNLGTIPGLLAPVAAEQNKPNGLGDVPVQLRISMSSGAQTMNYTPPTNRFGGQPMPASGRNSETYAQDYSDTSVLASPGAGYTTTIARPYLIFPLIEFGLVTINSNEFTKLMNS